jgi:hypothetical protein
VDRVRHQVLAAQADVPRAPRRARRTGSWPWSRSSPPS